MAEWYVKELSELTHISVQTLHHYDRIGLLKPSVRLSNGYRLYSEKDLLKLQQIIALKFFGFELAQIKILLTKEINLIDHLSAQSERLHDKAKILLDASDTLKKIIADCSYDKSIPWETIIQSIEVYRMVQQFEKSWQSNVFNAEELKKYALFGQEVKKRFTEEELKNISAEWQKIITAVKENLNQDPVSEFGRTLGKRAMDCVNHYYGKENIGLRNAIWEKGFKTGKVEHEGALSPECFAWLDNAINAYYQTRIVTILAQVGTQPDESVLKEWEAALIDMCGHDFNAKQEIFTAVFAHEKVTPNAKEWVKKFMKKN